MRSSKNKRNYNKITRNRRALANVMGKYRNFFDEDKKDIQYGVNKIKDLAAKTKESVSRQKGGMDQLGNTNVIEKAYSNMHDVIPRLKSALHDITQYANSSVQTLSGGKRKKKRRKSRRGGAGEVDNEETTPPETCTGISKMFGFCETKDAKEEKQRMKKCIADCAPPPKTKENQTGGKVKKSKKKRKKRKNKSYKKRH